MEDLVGVLENAWLRWLGHVLYSDLVNPLRQVLEGCTGWRQAARKANKRHGYEVWKVFRIFFQGVVENKTERQIILETDL